MKKLGLLVLLIVIVGLGAAVLHYSKNNMPNKAVENKENSGAEQKNVDALKDISTSTKISTSKEIVYFTNAAGKKFTGFYAEPESKTGVSTNLPGVIMIHEWWGLNKEIKDMAQELAGQGYRVLAVDLYGRPAVGTPDEARALTTSVSSAETTANMKAAFDYLKSQGSTKIASLGWCYGGGKSLELALTGAKLNAVVIYYGTPLVTDKNAISKIQAPVLGIFGDKDTAIPVSTVKDFEASLVMDDIKNEIEIYKGVGHAFANPSGASYAPAETKDAWAKTLKFLSDNLK